MYTQHQASPGLALAGKAPQLPQAWTGAAAHGAQAGAGASHTGLGGGHPQLFVAHVFVAQVLHDVAHELQLEQPDARKPTARTSATTALSRPAFLSVDRITLNLFENVPLVSWVNSREPKGRFNSMDRSPQRSA
jgi:hypothetical protein